MADPITIDRLAKLTLISSNDLLVVYDYANDTVKAITYGDLVNNPSSSVYWASGSNNFITTTKDIAFSTKLQHGLTVTASGLYSHAEGRLTTAIGSASHAEGNSTTGVGNYSHAEGFGSNAIGSSAHSEGYATTSVGSYSHAEGFNTKAVGNYSHTEGLLTTAIGQQSHAEGESNRAYAIGSHAEGYNTNATGLYSHAEGTNTNPSGLYSHAEGKDAAAYGIASHAEGLGTQASASYQHATGKYNSVIPAEGAFIIGNGVDNSNLSNLFEAYDNTINVRGDILTLSGSVFTPDVVVRNYTGTKLAISSTGQHQVFVHSSTDAYISNNYGETIVGLPYADVNMDVAISADGNYMTVVGPGICAYTANSGSTWTSVTQDDLDKATLLHVAIAMDDPRNQCVIVSDLSVVITHDAWSTPFTQTNPLSGYDEVNDVVMSADGDIIVIFGYNIVDGNSYIISNDGGDTWSVSQALAWLSGARIYKAAMSQSGRYIIAITQAGEVYRSDTYGVSWTSDGYVNIAIPFDICMSADGMNVYIAASTPYISRDCGVTWSVGGVVDSVAVKTDYTGLYQVYYGGAESTFGNSLLTYTYGNIEVHNNAIIKNNLNLNNSINILDRSGSGYVPFATVNQSHAENVYDLSYVGNIASLGHISSDSIQTNNTSSVNIIRGKLSVPDELNSNILYLKQLVITDLNGNSKFLIQYNSDTDALDTIKL